MKYFVHFYILSLFTIVNSEDKICLDYLIDNEKYLSNLQTIEVCDILKKNKNILISIINKNDNSLNIKEYTKTTFHNRCPIKGKSICKRGILLSIFITKKKISLFVGKLSKIYINRIVRKNIFAQMKYFLKKGKVYDSLIVGLNLLIYFTKNPNRNNHITTHRNSGHSTHFHSLFHPQYSFYNHNNHSHKYHEDNTAAFIIISVLMLFTVLVVYMFMNKENNTVNNQNHEYSISQTSEIDEIKEIHVHFNFLVKILKDIRTKNLNIIEIHFCLICMEDFDEYDKSLSVKRYNCGHLFHFDCSREFINCLCCFDYSHDGNEYRNSFNNPLNLNKTYDLQSHFNSQPNFSSNKYRLLINEVQIKTFIENFKEIYDYEDLHEYQRTYHNYSNEINNNDSLWGFASGMALGGMIGYGLSNHNNQNIIVVNNNQYTPNQLDNELDDEYDEDEW